MGRTNNQARWIFGSMCGAGGAGAAIADALGPAVTGPWAVMTGPEGGFAPAELDALANLPNVTRVDLGPRLLRAVTAALAALAGWQALAGERRGNRRAPPEE